MTGDRCTVSQMADVIMEGLEEYAQLAADDMKKAVKKAGTQARKDIQENAPVKTGAYAKSWATKTTKETANAMEIVVYSRNRYQLAHLLEKTGFPFTYDHFAEGESSDPPFICYLLPGSDNFAADGRVYFRISEVRIELYTDRKDPGAEALVETVLDDAGIFYNKSEVWIQSEKLYEVLYSMEL